MAKLLRHTAAPGHARDIDLFMSELFDNKRAIIEGRYGNVGRGEPPTPGMSKMIASVCFNAVRNGSASSQLAPIPLNIRRGGRPFGPRLIATCNCWPATSIFCTSILAESIWLSTIASI
jgi:hypothetical protein